MIIHSCRRRHAPTGIHISVEIFANVLSFSKCKLWQIKFKFTWLNSTQPVLILYTAFEPIYTLMCKFVNDLFPTHASLHSPPQTEIRPFRVAHFWGSLSHFSLNMKHQLCRREKRSLFLVALMFTKESISFHLYSIWTMNNVAMPFSFDYKCIWNEIWSFCFFILVVKFWRTWQRWWWWEMAFGPIR